MGNMVFIIPIAMRILRPRSRPQCHAAIPPRRRRRRRWHCRLRPLRAQRGSRLWRILVASIVDYAGTHRTAATDSGEA